jgi:hypothetical protein
MVENNFEMGVRDEDEGEPGNAFCINIDLGRNADEGFIIFSIRNLFCDHNFMASGHLNK